MKNNYFEEKIDYFNEVASNLISMTLKKNEIKSHRAWNFNICDLKSQRYIIVPYVKTDDSKFDINDVLDDDLEETIKVLGNDVNLLLWPISFNLEYNADKNVFYINDLVNLKYKFDENAYILKTNSNFSKVLIKNLINM